MKINKFNCEGCYAQAAYEAVHMTEREEKIPVVYICSPFSGDVEGNIKKARKYCRFAVDEGVVPIAVHLLFPQFMSDETEREIAFSMNMILMNRCDELWAFGEKFSSGMKREIAWARKQKILIRYFTKECEERE